MVLLSCYLGWKSNYYAGLGIFIILAWLGRRFLYIRWDPSTLKKFKRFRHLRRGYVSFLVIGVLWFASLFSELFINDRPLAVYYQGQLSFPTYGRVAMEVNSVLPDPRVSSPSGIAISTDDSSGKSRGTGPSCQ